MFAFKTKKSGGIQVTSGVHAMLVSGNAARDRRDWAAAAGHYRLALEQAPELTHIWVQLGHAAKESGDAAEARRAYGRAADLQSDDIQLFLSIGDLCKLAGEDQEAVRHYRRAIELEPDNRHALAGLAACERRILRGRRPNLPDGMSIEAAQARLDSMRWHHAIDFGGGLVSKSRLKLEFYEDTADALLHGLDLADKSLLDIGAWNGAYSFEAKRRGAARVVASDKYVWCHPNLRGRETFEFARQLTGLDVEAREIDVPGITPDSVGQFDVVLFSGVFYHLIDPIHLTRQISACARHALVLETHQDALDNPRPAMVFYPGRTLDGDPTNWWGPNPHCVYELLKEFGFNEIRYRDAPHAPGRKRGIYQAFRNRESQVAMGAEQVATPWLSLSDPSDREMLFAPR